MTLKKKTKLLYKIDEISIFISTNIRYISLFSQNINISWTRLGYTRPTLFQNLPALKYVDLRWNRLDHMHGPLMLPESFENLQLAGNPWNCSQTIKWLLNKKYHKFISDRHLLLCADSPYVRRPVVTVMEYKNVSL